MALKSHFDSKTTGEETEEEGKEDFFVKKFCYEGKSEDCK